MNERQKKIFKWLQENPNRTAEDAYYNIPGAQDNTSQFYKDIAFLILNLYVDFMPNSILKAKEGVEV